MSKSFDDAERLLQLRRIHNQTGEPRTGKKARSTGSTERSRKEIAAQTKDFLAGGGKIDHVRKGETGFLDSKDKIKNRNIVIKSSRKSGDGAAS